MRRIHGASLGVGLLLCPWGCGKKTTCSEALTNVVRVSNASEELSDDQKQEMREDLPRKIQACVAKQPARWVLDCFANARSIIEVDDCNRRQFNERRPDSR